MTKKTFGNYNLIACTAIAVTAGDSERQDAILVRGLNDNQVLYGYDFDSMDEEAFLDACENDRGAFSSEWEDLESVLIDGKAFANYVF